MVRISVNYPAHPGCRFNFDYYTITHMPIAIAKLSSSPGWQGVLVERGISGGAPGSAPGFVASCHFLFDSAEAFAAAFNAHAAELMADIPNYTDISPMIQVGEVLIAQ